MTSTTSTNNTQQQGAICLKKWRVLFVLLLIAILGADVIYHALDVNSDITHAGFYAWFSAISAVIWVGLAQLLKLLTKRSEKYYQREAEQA